MNRRSATGGQLEAVPEREKIGWAKSEGRAERDPITATRGNQAPYPWSV